MPLATIHRKLPLVAISKAEMVALKSGSDLKIAQITETSFAAANPNYLEVPAHPTHGITIEFIQAISLDTPGALRLRLQRPGFMTQPGTITGVVIVGVSGGMAGSGTLTFTFVGTLLSWQAPGVGAPGVAQNVGAGGVFELDGGAGSGQTLRVVVTAGGLPGANQVNVLVITETDDLIPVTLVPADEDVFIQLMTPLFIDRNVRVVFELVGLANGDDYSIFVALYRWRPATLSS